jgi:hypothetical protein
MASVSLLEELVYEIMESRRKERHRQLEQRHNYQILKERQQYGGFGIPERKWTSVELNAARQVIQIVAATRGVAYIPCHHPYYRLLLRQYLEQHYPMLRCKSLVNEELQHQNDSDLSFHSRCNRVIPTLLMEGNCCDRCGGKIDYQDDFLLLKGKNLLKVFWKESRS